MSDADPLPRREELERYVTLAQELPPVGQQLLARRHGFANFTDLAFHQQELARDGSPVSNFEAAADAIVAGDAQALGALLRQDPRLVHRRSTRDHHSTLLHYVSANGVEDFRQQTPKNIVDIARMLLDAGAEVDAPSDAYGGGSTTLGLVATSVHPESAGVQIALMELLLERGARIEEPGLTGNGHSAIRGCLANGQGSAARFFASRVSRMTLEEAAGVGRLDIVKSHFDERGALKDPSMKHQMEIGFLYACGYGAAAVVEFLLARGMDPDFRHDNGQTGLHWVAYGPHVEVAKILLQHGAQPGVKDRRGKTPLDWAVSAWIEAEDPTHRARATELVNVLAGTRGQ